ncbi:MAG: ABC transporter permease subunit [Clostridia bacterium]|nr:ABC transporter permease subunit [Clostridia bacterium]
MNYAKRVCRVLLIPLFWLLVWWVAAWMIAKPLLFPTPWAVLKRLTELMATKEFYLITANSIWNVVFGILIAVIGGGILSLITSRISLLREAILPIMTVIKATPVASFIILALIWMGSANVPTFITVLIVLPVVWTNLDEGFSHMDPQLIEVAKVYKMPAWRTFRILTLPTLKPYFVSACRTSMGLAWKAGIAAEIIAMPRNTIGTMIGDAKQYIMTEDMFAWTLTVILLSLVIEFLFAWIFRKLDSARKVRKEA